MSILNGKTIGFVEGWASDETCVRRQPGSSTSFTAKNVPTPTDMVAQLKSGAEVVRSKEDFNFKGRIIMSAYIDMPEMDSNCPVCFEMLIDPTTLNCGHNVCRHCLAQWYLSGQRQNCPVCHQDLLSRLRSRIMTQQQLQLSPGTDILQKVSTQINRELAEKLYFMEVMVSYGYALCIFLTVALFVWLTSSWFNGDGSTLLVNNPVQKWSVEEVADWIGEHGEWAKQMYAGIFKEHQIDGRLLGSLQEDDLGLIVGTSIPPVHKRALLEAIQVVQHLGVKPPKNLWEYKAFYPVKTNILAIGIKNHPRLLFLYLYWFDYQDSFLPFIHKVVPVENVSDEMLMANRAPPTLGQWCRFLPQLILCPYWLIAVFTWDWITVHMWTSCFVLISCVIYTVQEALEVKFSSVSKLSLESILGHVFGMMMQLFLLPLIPGFINIWFYLRVFVDPIFYLVYFVRVLSQRALNVA
ncbi:bifunctional apoptosis regulator-like [Lingula anatina]|uniref:Bifunctional apoptosis regulator-like n=1 Tax=Lingula anatina TaxID=7574 RepID=A0A1S3KFH6_LINAN|nr:bifunctional apoptosis regulator-like [Lingula anatina]|eukprot:XP_013421388.2 bifunctional apoptosis regulator-like [Lingula anatina]